jgi:dihydroorotate dehydrogenase electron transfer subunit
VPIAGLDRVQGRVDLFLPAARAGDGMDGLRRLREGETASLTGPLGRGFEIDPRSRFLLVVADEAGLPRVRAMADEAVATGRQVTLLLEAAAAASVYPSSLLPDEVEYVVATTDGSLGHAGPVTDLVPEYEAWADQCFAAGSSVTLERLISLERGRDERMGVARLGRRRGGRSRSGPAGARRRAWLQVALEHALGCALGICLGCVVAGTAGPLRTCREGPVFAADELRPERAR